MKNNEIPNLDAQLAYLANVKDEDIDFSDIPEITDWSSSMSKEEFQVLRKTRSVPLDLDVYTWFSNAQPNFQTAINTVLRNYMISHSQNL